MKRSELIQESQDHATMGNIGLATLPMLVLIESALARIARALEKRNDLEAMRQSHGL